MSNNEWKARELPDECPVCGENEHLLAMIESEHREDGVLRAQMRCKRGIDGNPGDPCGYTWKFTREP